MEWVQKPCELHKTNHCTVNRLSLNALWGCAFAHPALGRPMSRLGAPSARAHISVQWLTQLCTAVYYYSIAVSTLLMLAEMVNGAPAASCSYIIDHAVAQSE